MSPVRPESSQDAGEPSAPLPAAHVSDPAPAGMILGVGTVLLSLFGTGWLLARLAGFDYGLDQGIYAAVAGVMQEGGAPYRDAWDFKPPGVFFVYAVARGVLGDAMSAVRWLEVAGLVSLIAAFAIYSRRFLASVWPGLLGGALAVSGHVWLGFWHTAQPESFGVVLIAWALVLATTRASSARLQALAWAGAGATYTLAALLKPPLGGGILVSFAFAVRRAGPRVPALAFGAGAAAPLLLALVYFTAKDALGDMREALFVFVPAYTAINYQSGNLLVFGFRALVFLLVRFSPLNPLGLLLLVVLPRLAPREREGALHVLLVLLFCLLGVALQGRFFAYHYGAVVPLVALLAGWGLWKLVRLSERFALGAVGLSLALFFLLNSVGLEGWIPGGFWERARRIDAGHDYTAPQRRVAAWLRANTRPDDAIYVWGFQPMLYELSRRRPASRFVYNAPQRAPWFRERGRDALMRDLAEVPPAAILVESGDVHPGTAGTALDSATTLPRFSRLAALIASDYDAGHTVGSFKIHLRRGRGDPGGRPPAPP
jgi:hypothetical protein